MEGETCRCSSHQIPYVSDLEYHHLISNPVSFKEQVTVVTEVCLVPRWVLSDSDSFFQHMVENFKDSFGNNFLFIWLLKYMKSGLNRNIKLAPTPNMYSTGKLIIKKWNKNFKNDKKSKKNPRFSYKKDILKQIVSENGILFGSMSLRTEKITIPVLKEFLTSFVFVGELKE